VSKKILLLTCFIVGSLHVFAEQHIMFEKANQLYRNKNYDSAISLYQQMMEDGYESGELYYNAGNAFYRNNQIGYSVWCYRKALQIHPENKNYMENLQLAKRRIREPIDEMKNIFFVRWWKNVYSLMSMNGWAMCALILFISGFVILFGYLFSLRILTQVPKRMAYYLFGISIFSLWMMRIQYHQSKQHYEAIIVEPNVSFFDLAKKENYKLEVGNSVRVHIKSTEKNQSKKDLIFVVLPDGREGRINKMAIKKL
jgi:pentatricopeptide repeat protein